MPKKSLPPELVSLVHHVELNKSGWWKKAIRRLIIAVICISGRRLDSKEIKEALLEEFGVELDDVLLGSQIEILQSKNILISIAQSNSFFVSQDYLAGFQEEFDEAEKEEENVKKQFSLLINKYCDGLNGLEIWEEFNSNFLLPTIGSIGANTYKLITGDKSINGHVHLEQFLDKYDNEHAAGLRQVLTEFISPKNLSARTYILKNLSVYFFLESTKIPTATLKTIENSQKKKPTLRLFLDSNFLFSVLELHENPADSAAMSLFNLSETLKKKVNLKLYIIQETIDEAQRVFKAAAFSLSKYPVPHNIASVALNFKLNGIVAKYLDVCKKAESPISPIDYFEPYLNHFPAVLKGKGIEIFRNDSEVLRKNQVVIDDIVSQYKREETKIEGAKQKNYEAIEHDMLLWHSVQNARPKDIASSLDARDWVVTLDYRLLAFDQYKQQSSGNYSFRGCLHPTNLIQLLQFWIPLSKEVEENILNSMRLPLIFNKFDSQDEAVTLQIVRALSRFEEANDLTEETIKEILIDKALRLRMEEDINEDERVQLIKEALIKQHNEIKKKLDEEKKASLKLQNDLDKERRERNNVLNRLSALEEKTKVEDENAHFISRYIKWPGYALVIFSLVIYLVEKDSTLGLQLTGLFVTLYGIIWTFVITKIVNRPESINKLKAYQYFQSFSMLVYASLVFVGGVIGKEFIARRYDEVINWFSAAIDSLFN